VLLRDANVVHALREGLQRREGGGG
jgi:hypothetical protein